MSAVETLRGPDHTDSLRHPDTDYPLVASATASA